MDYANLFLTKSDLQKIPFRLLELPSVFQYVYIMLIYTMSSIPINKRIIRISTSIYYRIKQINITRISFEHFENLDLRIIKYYFTYLSTKLSIICLSRKIFIKDIVKSIEYMNIISVECIIYELLISKVDNDQVFDNIVRNARIKSQYVKRKKSYESFLF